MTVAITAACSSLHDDDAKRNVMERQLNVPVGGGHPLVTGWSGSWDALGGTGTSLSPSIAFDGWNVYAFYLDGNSELQMSHAPVGGGAWSAWTPLDAAAGTPSVVQWQSYLAVFYRHAGDNHLRMIFDSGSWAPPVDLGVRLSGDPVATLITSPSNPGEKAFDVYGIDADYLLGHTIGQSLAVWFGDLTGWSPWQQVAGAPVLDPGPWSDLSVLSSDGATVDVMANQWGQLVHGHEDTSQNWTWEYPYTVQPVARLSSTSHAGGEVDTIWSDASGNAYEKTVYGGYGNWFNDAILGGDGFRRGGMTADSASAATRPQIVPWQNGFLYAQTQSDYAIEVATGGILYTDPAWTNLGTGCGAYGTEIAMMPTASGQVDILAVGSDHLVYHTVYTTNGVSGGAQLPACSCGTNGALCCGQPLGAGDGCASGSVCDDTDHCVSCGQSGSSCCEGYACGANLTCLSEPTTTGFQCIACGFLGQGCCDGNEGFCNGDATCILVPGASSTSCQTCGVANTQLSACCTSGPACVDSTATCFQGTCLEQGHQGEQCLPDGSCTDGLFCHKGTCVQEGHQSEPCLPDGSCLDGLSCMGDTCDVDRCKQDPCSCNKCSAACGYTCGGSSSGSTSSSGGYGGYGSGAGSSGGIKLQ
jgi:hypothetical protein